MKEAIKLNIKGKVTITSGDKVILEKDNHIQPESMDIIRKCISIGTPRITQIKVLNGATELVTVGIPQNLITFPGIEGSVRFKVILQEDSFAGDFNGLHLLSSNNLPFSKLTGFDPITKTFDNQIVIEWVLTIEVIT